MEESNNFEGDQRSPSSRAGIPVRLGCGSILLFTLLCSLFMLATVRLVADGEIDLRSRNLLGYRIWLVREGGNLVVGFSTSNEVGSNAAPNTTCIESKVRFLGWRSGTGTSEVEFCECYETQEESLTFIGECPP